MTEENIQASIITIGDELMIGQVIDTNSAWLAGQLNNEGIWVRKRVAVGDHYGEMWKALDEESKISKIILITGGLGPTADDITKPFLCDYFGTRLIIDNDVLAHNRYLFEVVFKRPFIERNIKQAEVPEGCTVLHNSRGTAPGMAFEKNGVIYISMPGVPHEMKGIMQDHVLPLIRKKFSTGHIMHRTLLTAGIGESFLAEHISAWESALPSSFKLAYLPNLGMVRLRLTASGMERAALESELDRQFSDLKDLVEQWLVADEDISLPEVIIRQLASLSKTVGTAESCTGGYIAHLLTKEAGASSAYKGSVVTYANELKTGVLGVNATTLQQFGAVSEETVREMAKGALNLLKTDYTIAVSGIMGPDGGTETKPVGTVWIAVAGASAVISKSFSFRYDRTRNIEMTATQALNMLRIMINDDKARKNNNTNNC